MNERAVIGGNNPPDPIDEISAAYEGARIESENWLDGTAVQDETQMKAVDALRKDMRAWRLGLEAGQKSATAPLHDAYRAEQARWNPVITDAKQIEAGLVKLVDGFKRKLTEAKEAERQKAEAEAWAATRAAQDAARQADASNIEAQRAATQAQADAKAAQARAAKAGADTVKGLRTVARYEVTDHRALLNWIAANRRDDLTAFIDEWAKRNHKGADGAAGLRVWNEKEAF